MPEAETRQSGPIGLQGWLLAFIGSQVLGVLLGLVALKSALASGGWVLAYSLLSVSGGVFGLSLIARRSAYTRRFWLAFFTLVAILAATDGWASSLLVSELAPTVGPEARRSFESAADAAFSRSVGGVLAAGLWGLYWYRSRRVANTFTPAVPSEATVQAIHRVATPSARPALILTASAFVVAAALVIWLVVSVIGHGGLLSVGWARPAAQEADERVRAITPDPPEAPKKAWRPTIPASVTAESLSERFATPKQIDETTWVTSIVGNDSTNTLCYVVRLADMRTWELVSSSPEAREVLSRNLCAGIRRVLGFTSRKAEGPFGMGLREEARCLGPASAYLDIDLICWGTE